MNKIINHKPIFVVSGVAASGKGSVAAALRDNPGIVFSISCTTRSRREGEVEGRDYYFISDNDFDKAVDKNDFIEWEHVHENRYGTRKSDLMNIIKNDKIALLEIDVNGAENIKNLFSNVITVFIMPSNIEECYKRLDLRNTESDSSKEIRKSRYALEIDKSKNYDYIIINDDLGKAQSELLQLTNKYL